MDQKVESNKVSSLTPDYLEKKTGKLCSGFESQNSSILPTNGATTSEAGSDLKTPTTRPPGTNVPPTQKSPIPDSAGTDSGYASQSSSPDIKDTFVVESSVKSKRLLPLSRKKTIKLKLINKPISHITQARFSDLRELHADSLNKLTKGLPRCQGILMSLKILGENEDSASPWVFVQCDKIIAKKVKDFFKQREIKEDFQPRNPNIFSPYFQIYICELPPKPLVKQNEEPEFSDAKAEIDHNNIPTKPLEGDDIYDSSCGKAIKIYSNRTLPRATFGGFIKLGHKDGASEIFGMTAGHFSTSAEEGDIGKDNGELENDSGNETADSSSESGDHFEIDLDFLTDTTDVVDEDPLPCPSWSEFGNGDELFDAEDNWCLIGSVHEISQTACKDRPNLDWALVKIADPDVYRPNVIMSKHVSNFKLPVDEISERKSYLMLSPGQVLARTHLVTLGKNEALQSGDSGAWVVDCETMEVYGHVVASNVFGGVYIVPMFDTFEDIKERLSVASISLPLLHHVPKQAMKAPGFAYESTGQVFKGFEGFEKISFGKGAHYQNSFTILPQNPYASDIDMNLFSPWDGFEGI